MICKIASVCLALFYTTATWGQLPLSSQDIFVDRLFAEAGFPPLTTASDAPVDVRHLIVHDPYSILPIPGVAVERFADGRTELTLRYWGWSEAPVRLDDSQWQRLVDADLEDRANGEARRETVRLSDAQRAAQTPPGSVPSEPPPMPAPCHAWSARLRNGAGVRDSWRDCGNGPTPAVVVEMLAIALETRPGCTTRADDPFWSFERCFRAAAFDNAELGAALAALQADDSARPVRPPLLEAWAFLVVPGLALGSPDWIIARTKVDAFRTLLADKRAQLHRINRFDRFAMTQADRVRSDAQLRTMHEFLDAQDRNLIELLTRLASVGG